MSELTIKEYTKNDFDTSQPYEDLYSYRGNPFDHDRVLRKMAERAKSVGFSGFKTTYKNYCKSLAKFGSETLLENIAEVDDLQGFNEINTGIWTVDSSTGAIYKETDKGVVYACNHFIFPMRIYVDVESAREKILLAWRKNRKWRFEAFDRVDLATASQIVKLASFGIAVTSETARALVQWLSDAEELNCEAIREEKSVSRLGYIGDFGFSPYTEGLNYDGSPEYADVFKSIKAVGKYEAWLDAMKHIRADRRLAPKIILASSFASVLLEPCACLSFFVHLYGGTGNGKTVALKVAASVWGNPNNYVRTFNSTAVGLEMIAGFLRNLPLCMDELQIQRTQGGNFEPMIYQLTEGTGRTRGSKAGGLRATANWRLAILTSGETPIVSASSAGGAVNRVIEIDTTDSDALFDEPTKLVSTLTKNYGHAGKAFIEALKDEDFEEYRELQQYFFSRLIGKGITDKQAMSGSVLLLADTLIDKFIFRDGELLDIDEFAKFLKTNIQVSEHFRAHDWLMAWIAQNYSNFGKIGGEYVPKVNYGTITRDNSVVYIIKSVFDSACADEGYDSNGLLKWLKRHNLTICEGERTTKKVRIADFPNPIRCVGLKLNVEPETNEEVPNGFELIREDDLDDEPI